MRRGVGIAVCWGIMMRGLDGLVHGFFA